MRADSISKASAIRLPEPEKGQRHSVLAVLEKRQTIREMSDEPLPRQVLANILWAACGVNRQAGPLGIPGRTAFSAGNSQEIDVYVVLKEGAYLYNAMENRLDPVSSKDLRAEALTPGQPRTSPTPPVQLIYVADVGRLARTQGFDEPGLYDPETQKAHYYVDTGFIAGNVYVYAAAVGLAAWFHECEKLSLAQHLGLRPEQRVLFGQSVGYREEDE